MEEINNSVFAATLFLVFLPLVSFVLLIFGEKLLPLKAAWIGVLSQLGCLVFSIIIFREVWDIQPYALDFEWFALGENLSMRSGIWIDNHSAIMLIVVNLVALLVNIYSIEYKKGDRHYHRFFAYLGFFIFAMNGLVVADNLLTLFIFWELVGFASYLLIGFWFDKEAAVKANKKAFIVNRVADLGLLMAIMIFWSEYDTVNIHQLKHVVFHFHESFFLLHLAGFGLFLGCMGKSAQFPFQIWLPDAMEGPTPVSALIHAATMVAAGIYLMVKMAFLLTPDVLNLVAIIGAFTAFAAAFFAITQTDLKRVLAFSTVSQLGFMMAGIGSGGSEAAFFHLITHAFFKACLFLSAGSVIHALHHAHHGLETMEKRTWFDKQDMRNMGGLWKLMPFTFIAYTLSGLALAGVPFFSGFLSKDAILVTAYANALESVNGTGSFVFVMLVATSCLTAFYVFKQLFVVFGGKLRIDSLLSANHIHVHENKVLMVIPLLILAVLSTAFIFSINPFDFENGWIMKELIINHDLYSQNHGLIALVSIGAVAFGLIAFVGRNWFITNNLSNTFIHKISFNQLYMNEITQYFLIRPKLYISQKIANFDSGVIDRSVNLIGVGHVVLANVIAWTDKMIVDGFVNGLGWLSKGTGKLFAKSQNGQIQSYILYALLVLILLILFIFIYL